MATTGDPDVSPDRTTPDSNQQPTNDEKLSINLSGVAQTLLIPLIARASDNTLPDPILGDSYAQDALATIEVDADALKMSPLQNCGIAVRTSQFDRWTTAFLRDHANTTVLHLACGFDSRMQRVTWGDNTRWIDIDLPEVIALRRQIPSLSSLPGRDYSLLGVDILDENWMQEIGEVPGPVLVIMEGLLAYLPETGARGLLRRICQTFSEGEMLFESVSSASLKWLNRPQSLNAVNATGAVFQSSIDDPTVLEELDPSLKLAESVPVVQAPGTEKFPLFGRVLMYVTSWWPSGRDAARLLRFRFGGTRAPGESAIIT